MIIRIFILCLFLTGCQTVQQTAGDIGRDITNAMPDLGLREKAQLLSPSQKLLAEGSCPDITLTEDLQMVHDFVPNQKPLPNTLISRADIADATITCTTGETNITAKTNITFTAMRGAASASEPQAPVNADYFLAVTKRNGKILAKEIFPVSIVWNADQNAFVAQDAVKQLIPLQKGQNGNDYNITIGFQMAEDDLTFNRELLAAQKKAREKAEQDADKTAEKAIKETKTAEIVEKVKAIPPEPIDLTPAL